MLFTIFTPTFNRSNLLINIFHCLKVQEFKDFEWVIIDDGSTDDTRVIVDELINKSFFTIKYFYQENSGKHIAHNQALKQSLGEFFIILDSDDTLTPNSLLLISNLIDKNISISGLVFRRIFHNNKIVGTQFRSGFISNNIDLRYKFCIKGDFVEIFKTKVLLDYLFPESDEKFCPEDLLWNRLSISHQIVFYNEGIYLTEYLKGGLTDRIVKIRMNSPLNSMLYYSELLNYNIPIKFKLKGLLNFWRFSFNSNLLLRQKLKYLNNSLFIIFLPVGYFIYLLDKFKYA
jgi:glycosyltransferase involved in cell wall biosynthesis